MVWCNQIWIIEGNQGNKDYSIAIILDHFPGYFQLKPGLANPGRTQKGDQTGSLDPPGISEQRLYPVPDR